jgi:hypothetical protein
MATKEQQLKNLENEVSKKYDVKGLKAKKESLQKDHTIPKMMGGVANSVKKAVNPMKFSSLSGGRSNESFPRYGAVGNTQTTTPQTSAKRGILDKAISGAKKIGKGISKFASGQIDSVLDRAEAGAQAKRDEIRKNHVPESMMEDYDKGISEPLPDMSVGGAIKKAKDKLFGNKATTTKPTK